jgi:hypothetical protein
MTAARGASASASARLEELRPNLLSVKRRDGRTPINAKARGGIGRSGQPGKAGNRERIA